MQPPTAYPTDVKSRMIERVDTIVVGEDTIDIIVIVIRALTHANCNTLANTVSGYYTSERDGCKLELNSKTKQAETKWPT